MLRRAYRAPRAATNRSSSAIVNRWQPFGPGLELDPGKTYSFASHPHQIKGVEDYDDLRGPEWGNKFLAASLDDDIIIATAQLALKEAAHVEAITTNAGGKGDFFNDDTARAWLLELHNNRPAYTHVAVEKAVAAGARDAKDRDKFLDVLAAAIEDSYERRGRHDIPPRKGGSEEQEPDP